MKEVDLYLFGALQCLLALSNCLVTPGNEGRITATGVPIFAITTLEHRNEIATISVNLSDKDLDEVSMMDADLDENNDHDDGEEEDEDEEESTEGIFPKPVYIFLIYLIFILGVIGNTLVFILMQQKSLRSNSYSVYLSFLAVMDTLVLITVCLEDILEHQFDILDETFYTSSYFICKFWSFLLIASGLASPWFVVAFTGDRYIAVVFPFHRKLLSSRKTALVASLIIMSVVSLESLVMQIVIHVINDGQSCENLTESLELYFTFRNLFLVSTLPCTVILYFNLHIIVGIKRSSKFRKSAGDQEKEKAKADRRITVSLVAVSLMAFCCLTPVAITEVAETIWMRMMDDKFSVFTNTTDMDEYRRLNNRILVINEVWPVLNFIKLLNFAQNFYVMMLTCKKYREAFLGILSCSYFRRITSTDLDRKRTKTTQLN